MNKDKFYKLITVFLFLNPILDVITTYQTKYNFGYITIGTLIRGLFFLITLIYMFKNNIKRKYIIIFIIYVVLAMLYNFLYLKNSFVLELSNIVLIYYLPMCIFFFENINNKKIDEKLIFILYLVYVNLIIIPYLFKIGFNTYDSVYNKKGFLGLFYSGNEISAILIGLLPVIVNYLLKMKNNLLKIILGLEILVAIFMVGTKTLILGLLITILYFLVCFIKNNYNNISLKTKIISISVLALIVAIIIVISPKLPITRNLKITLNYYNVNNVKDLLKIENIDNVIFSGRLTYLKKVNKFYFKQNVFKIILGIGRQGLIDVKDVEIDIFDIFYSIGIIGTVIYLAMIIDCFKNNNLKKHYKLSVILFILMSLFSGHVLIRPMVSIYFALVFILNKNSLTKV